MTEVYCGFCMERWEVEESQLYPEHCPHCKMVRCDHCATWLKGPSPGFCFGCGTFKPAVNAVIGRSSSTGAVYHQQWWCEWVRGRHSDAVYSVSFGADGTFLSRTKDGKYETIREITAEEFEIFYGPKTKKPSGASDES